MTLLKCISYTNSEIFHLKGVTLLGNLSLEEVGYTDLISKSAYFLRYIHITCIFLLQNIDLCLHMGSFSSRAYFLLYGTQSGMIVHKLATQTYKIILGCYKLAGECITLVERSMRIENGKKADII
jgi:hypothetical protein